MIMMYNRLGYVLEYVETNHYHDPFPVQPVWYDGYFEAHRLGAVLWVSLTCQYNL